MSNETYRQFDPWRPSPVKEISRRQIVETHYFNVDHVSYESNQIGSFERYFVQENNGDTVAELAEEAGFDATKLTQFTRFMNTPSYSTQHTAIFFATGLTPASRQEIGPETPRSDVRMVSVDDAYEMVVNGTIVDAKTMVAILRLKSGTLDHLND